MLATAVTALGAVSAARSLSVFLCMSVCCLGLCIVKYGVFMARVGAKCALCSGTMFGAVIGMYSDMQLSV